MDVCVGIFGGLLKGVRMGEQDSLVNRNDMEKL